MLCKCGCKQETKFENKYINYHNTGQFRFQKGNIPFIKSHGMSNGINRFFYEKYIQMIQRCSNSNVKGYKNYGGRGIKVEWKSFEDFRNDMYASYLQHKQINSSTTIERINNDGNYSKENCRWATWQEQANNRRPKSKKNN